MGDSPAINVVVGYPTVNTDLSMWDLTPKSGSLPFIIAYGGYLWRQGITENQSDSTIVDGETVQLQVLFPGGSWSPVGPAVTTGYIGGTGYHGYYSGTLPLSAPSIYPGTFGFRIHYAGNASKGLLGCEDGVLPVVVNQEVPPAPLNPLLVLGAILGITFVGYGIYRMVR